MRNLLFDTCFWFALIDPRDSDHEKANQMFEEFTKAEIKILIPFPSLYETMNTDFVERKDWLFRFNQIIQQREKVILVYDTEYREAAYQNTVHQHKDTKISLVDSIIMEMASTAKLKIDAIVSFNMRDFSPFCQQRQIPLLCYPGGLF